MKNQQHETTSTEPLNTGSLKLGSFLWAVPVAAAVLSAIDVVATRIALPHRPLEVRLFVDAVLMYAVFAALSVPFAILLNWILSRRRPTPSALRAPLLLIALVGSAVIAHAALNRFTGLDADVSALRSPAPWLSALGAVGIFGVILLIVARVTARLPRGAASALLILAALSAGFFAPPSWLNSRELPAIEVEAPPDAPNILLLIWDTARRQSFSIYGYDRETTPRLAEFAENARRFSAARSVTHYTFTSHLSMLSGKLPTEHGARLVNSRYDRERAGALLQERLREAGYRTGAFVGTGVLRASTGIATGFEVYDDAVDPGVTESYGWALVHDLQSVAAKLVPALAKHGNPHWIEDFQRPADEVLERAKSWIDSDDERPWFCMVNLFDVHWPYTPDATAREHWVGDYDGPMDGYVFRSDDLPRGHQPTEDDDQFLLELYDAEMWRLDTAVADFLDGLDLDTNNTAVLMTADHGEAFGEGEIYGHDDLLEPQVSVPFVLRLPADRTRDGASDAPVSGVDVTPTLLSIAGFGAGNGSGQSLLANDPSPERPVWVEDRDFHPSGGVERFELALYQGHFKLVRSLVADEERWALYDLDSDPIGIVDVSASNSEVFESMRTQMLEERPAWPDNRDGSKVESAGGTTDDALQALGYLDPDGNEPGD